MRYMVATDGSEASLKATRFLAQQSCPGRDDEVFVVYVFPLPPDPEIYADVAALPTDAGDERVAEVAKPILERTRAVLADLESRAHEVVLVGNPAKEIVELATNIRADLIVAGTRGRSSSAELYLGSISSALTHRAPCSVLIVR